MTSRNKDRVFANTKMMLDRATAGLDGIKSGDPKRRQSGLMNMITFGRSVTLTLQTLKVSNHRSRSGMSRFGIK